MQTNEASSYKPLVSKQQLGHEGENSYCDFKSSPKKERAQWRLRGSRHWRVCWPDGAWLEHHREAHCNPSWGCRAFQALGQESGIGGLLAVVSWVTWASPGAERRRRMWKGEGQILNPGFDRAVAEPEGNDWAETEAQAQDLHRLWVVGKGRGWFGSQTHPHFPFACGRVQLPRGCQNGVLLCPGTCPAPCRHSCQTGGGAWALPRSAGSFHRWPGGCAHTGGWNWAEGGEEETACLSGLYTLNLEDSRSLENGWQCYRLGKIAMTP